MLTPLKCIPCSKIENMPLSHDWSDWDPYQVLGTQNPETEATLSDISDRAILGYSIACAEWVVCRFKKHLNDQRPYQYIQACWIYEMSDEVAAPPQSKQEEWEGPVRGPVDLSLMTVLNTIYSMDDGAAWADGAFAELIPLLVVTPCELFLQWRFGVFKRLKERYPRSDGEFGKPVPREIFDLSQALVPEQELHLVKAFLSKALAAQNPFVRIVK